MSKINRLALGVMLLGLAISSAQGMLLPNMNNNTTESHPNNNANNTALLQLINSRTQQADKAFKNVNYKKMSGNSKSGFFDHGGLGDIDGDTQFKRFHIQHDSQGAD